MHNYSVKSVQRFPTYHILSLTPDSEDERLDFWPGQYAAISFKNGNRPLSPARCFSMVSSPNSAELQFSMRPHGKFTRKVTKLQPGDSVKVQGAFGNFILDPSDKNIIMLAAGIGITPFMSMLRYTTETRVNTPITLLYACPSRDDIPFKAELDKLQAQKPNLRVVYVVKQGASDPANNIYVGRVNEALLQKITEQKWQPFTYFICGPDSFTNSLQQVLKQHDVDDERIVTETFTQATRLGWGIKRKSIDSLTYAWTAATMFVGIAFIMALDLVGFLPKTSQASAATTNNSSSVPATTSPVSSSTATTTSTPTSSQPTQTTYQQPMTCKRMLLRFQKLGVALGSEVMLTVLVKNESEAKRTLETLWANITAFEKRFSRFLADSELSTFNAQAGQETKISAEFRQLLLVAQKYSLKTDGLYNPFILPSLQRAGYIGSWPNTGDYDQALNYSIRQVVGIEELIINKSSATIPANSALDFGGIGKGYLLDQLSAYLDKSNIKNYWLSLGGDIISSGHDLENKNWIIGIADSGDDEVAIETIDNKGIKMALATSGTTIRKGLGWHHIIDPRTGLSADTDIITATVVVSPPAGGGVEADIYAKCLLILGSAEAESYATKNKLYAIVQTLAHSGKKALHYGQQL